MDYKVEKISSATYRLTLTVPEEEISERVERDLREIRKDAEIPGFRKGKAPLNLIKARYGKKAEKDAIIDLAFEKSEEILTQENYRVWGAPYLISHKRTPEGASIVIEFDVEPEIELQKIDGFKLVKSVREVTDEDIEQFLNDMRDDRAVWRAVEDGAREGHIIHADLQEIDAAGTPIIGRKYENRYLQLGDGEIGAQLSEQLAGVKPGDERNIVLDYSKAGGEGKEYFKVHVKAVHHKKLPELNDEFAQSVGEFKNLDELKDRIRKSLEFEAEIDAQERLEEEVIDELIRNNPFDLPPRIVEYALEETFREYAKDRTPKPDREEFFEKNRPMAVRQFKWIFLKERIAEQEGLKVTEQELEEEIEKIASFPRRSKPEDIRRYYRNPKARDELREQMLRQKIMQRILENCKIRVVKVRDESKLIELA